MEWLTSLNARLSRWALYIAVAALLSIVAVVFYGVVMRYVFHDAPPWVEQVALVLVITVAMFAASATVREAGHIGMDSMVIMLPLNWQFGIGAILFGGSLQMAMAVHTIIIPTLGVPQSIRYAPCVIAGILIVLFSVEQLIAMWQGKEVVQSWH